MRKLMIVLSLALLLAACGGSDDNEAAPPETAAMSDESMSDESMSDESMSDESMSDESMSDEHPTTTFTVTITNATDTSTLATPLAPGAFIVHSAMETLFAEGSLDRGEGLEPLAEDGDPAPLAGALGSLTTVSASGVFATPDGGDEAGPALPGASYSFTFEAAPGDYLSFATMFVQSNDWFYAPASSGIELFDGASPLTGDISDLVLLWDAGTEVDESPGEGPNQAPRQSGPNTGENQDAPIAIVAGYDGGLVVTITTN